MKLAVFSDVHANYKAFEAFLNYIEKHPVDGIIGLGDYVTDCPYPRKTLELLYDLMEKYPLCHILRGNREEYLLANAKESQGWHKCSQNGALYYTSLELLKEDMAFFEGLPSVKRVQLEGYPELTLCHGAPEVVRGNFEYDLKLREEVMKSLPTKYLLGGHSHHQEAAIEYGNMYINPGSLGLAIDHKGGHAEFAILEGTSEGWEPQLISIPYDLDGLLEDFTASGLDEYGMVLNRAVKKTLKTGENCFYYAVVEAIQMSGKPLAEVEEDIWGRVAEKLEL